MKASRFPSDLRRPEDETLRQYNLMLLRLQEAAAWHPGHRDGDKFDRLGICLRAYDATLWLGGMGYYPLRCAYEGPHGGRAERHSHEAEHRLR
jgi:hypothetical protein